MCHNDLVAVNYLYIEKTESIIVLDWEFSGLGDIYYDLATVVYTHDSEGPISPELEMEMLKCYFGSVTAFQQRRLLGMKYMLMLFTGLWGLAQTRHANRRADPGSGRSLTTWISPNTSLPTISGNCKHNTIYHWEAQEDECAKPACILLGRRGPGCLSRYPG